MGTFTSFHTVGYGMLYTLTGDKKYADLSRKSLELTFGGANDRAEVFKHSVKEARGWLENL